MAQAAKGRPAHTPSTMGNWVHAIIRTLEARGLRGMDIALEAGISLRAIRNPQERVPQPAVTALWRKAVEASGDPCFGLHVPRHVTVSTFGALAYALFASRDLRSGLGRVVRYQRMISDAVQVYLEGRYSVEEVAFLLGFADAATFSRAFKRWTGTSPARFAGDGE